MTRLRLHDPTWLELDMAFIVAVPGTINLYQLILGINGKGPFWVALLCFLTMSLMAYLSNIRNGAQK
jgi:hypothetical protein